MKKETLLFHAPVLANGITPNHNRSGIFFVAWQAFKLIVDSKNFTVNLFCPENKVNNLNLFLKSVGYENLNIISSYAQIALGDENCDIDIFFSPNEPAPPEIQSIKKIKKIIILYDVSPIALPEKETHSSPFINYLMKHLYPDNYYICISEFTKNEFLRFSPSLDPSKMPVVYLAAGENYYLCTDNKLIADVKIRYKIPEDKKYILSVCTLGPRKNHKAIVSNFVKFIDEQNIDDLYLVLVGGNMENFRKTLEDEIESFAKYSRFIIITGYAQDDELAPLYSGALFSIYLSIYEGFGLPILEAMKCGCPVIASSSSSMPEVTGDAGLSVHPRNNDQILDAISQMYFNEEKRKKFKLAGLARAGEFSWDNFGRGINSVIKNIDQQFREISVPIVMITDDNYIVPTAAAIQSIIENKSCFEKYNIFVIFTGSDKEKILKFNEFNNNHVVVTVIFSENTLDQFNRSDLHVTSAALKKFNLAEILSTYDKILYLDSDVIVNGNITPLLEMDLGNKYAAVISDIIGVVMEKNDKRLGLDNYFNSGVMLLNSRKMREEHLSQKMYELKVKKPGKFMDQDIFNEIFSGEVIFIDGRYNLMMFNMRKFSFDIEEVNLYYNWNFRSFELIEKSAYIIHITNNRKPWKYRTGYKFDEWIKFYQNSPLGSEPLDLIDEPENKKTLESIVPNVTLSMTSYPARINSVAETFKSLFHQTLKADRYLLWLAFEQFPGRENDLPDSVLDLIKKGVEIRWCSNLKPHTKYYYVMKEFPNDIIITVDDDITYRPDTIEILMQSYKKHPKAISCHRSHRITFDNGGNIKPYRQWGWECKDFIDTPRMDLFATGVLGVLYPPKCLHQFVFNLNDIKTLCLNNDDIWLKFMQVMCKVPVVQVKSNAKLDFIDGSQENTLNSTNVLKDENDTIIASIISKYNKHFGNNDTLLHRIKEGNVGVPLLTKSEKKVTDTKNKIGKKSWLTSFKMKFLPPSSRSFHERLNGIEGLLKTIQSEMKSIRSQANVSNERINSLSKAVCLVGDAFDEIISKQNVSENNYNQLLSKQDTAENYIKDLFDAYANLYDYMKSDFKNELINRINIIEQRYLEHAKSLQDNNLLSKEIRRYAEESVWAQIFNNTIKDSPWLNSAGVAPGRSAIGYPCLYVIYRILCDVQPKKILELGLGLSTMVISQYAYSKPDVKHFIVEHDSEWIDFYSKSHPIKQTTEIVNLDLKFIPFNAAEKVRVFSGFKERFFGEKFNFIVIDAPLGVDMKEYSRIDVISILPECLESSFIILMDDFDRVGEQATCREIESTLTNNGIKYHKAEYKGIKDLKVICSVDLKFVCSL